MSFRLASAAALVALLFSSCASDSNLTVVSKSRSYSSVSAGGLGGFTTAQPSASLFQQAAGKPKDKHGMAFYKPSERNRLVRTTAYTCSEDDHLQYGSQNATGTPLRYTDRVRSAAADWAVYPVGTVSVSYTHLTLPTICSV